jgi:hypothetical protein
MSLPKSYGIKTEHKVRAVVQLVHIFSCLLMIGLSKMNERLHDMTLHRILLNISVSQKINK